jgi:hypothetical protein
VDGENKKRQGLQVKKNVLFVKEKGAPITGAEVPSVHAYWFKFDKPITVVISFSDFWPEFLMWLE